MAGVGQLLGRVHVGVDESVVGDEKNDTENI